MDAMTTPTPSPSPAAQAVWDAYKSGGLDAALIAAAREIEPTMEERRVRQHGRQHGRHPDFFNGISCAAAQLLALAAELRREGQP
jgi:hypothetical protein